MNDLTKFYHRMTDEQKEFCIRTMQWVSRIREFPEGNEFIADLFRSMVGPEGLTVVKESDPKISMRREVTQELYDMLYAARELRRKGFTLQTSDSLGMAAIYASHGVAGLQRWLELATDAALHNAGLEGFRPTPTRKESN